MMPAERAEPVGGPSQELHRRVTFATEGLPEALDLIERRGEHCAVAPEVGVRVAPRPEDRRLPGEERRAGRSPGGQQEKRDLESLR